MQGKTVSLTATFKEVASNKTVDLDGLGQAVEIVGCERPPNLAELLAQHDADGDGKLTLEQFKAILSLPNTDTGTEKLEARVGWRVRARLPSRRPSPHRLSPW